MGDTPSNITLSNKVLALANIPTKLSSPANSHSQTKKMCAHPFGCSVSFIFALCTNESKGAL